MARIAERKVELESRLDVLVSKLHDIAVELDSHQSRDWEELAVEREGDEVLEREGCAGKAEIAAIRAALLRIDEDLYGQCMRCGDDIAEARLDLLPFTPFCAECARAVQH